MPKPKIRKLSDHEFNQLLILTSGYLPLVNGDVRRAMARALAAHQDLIQAAKHEAIAAEVPEGRVTLVVPEDGGLAVRMDSTLDP